MGKMGLLVSFETLPEMFNRITEYYRGQNRIALRYKDKRTKEWTGITWDEFRRRAEALAAYFYEKGVRKGDRIAILSENRPEWAITDQAIQMLGAVNVAIYTTLPASQVAYLLQDSGSKMLLASTSLQLRKAEEVFDDCPDLQEVITLSELRKEHPTYVRTWDEVLREGEQLWEKHGPEVEKLRDSVQPDDLSSLIYTSGTTGLPKGVMLTHRNFCSNVKAAVQRVPFGQDDEHLSFLPLAHSFERTAGYHAVLSCGALINYAESIEAVNKNLLEVHPTVLISVPRLFERVYNILQKRVQEGSAIQQKIFHWAVRTGQKVANVRMKGKEPNPILQAQYNLAFKLVFSKLHERLGGRVRFAVSGGAALPKHVGEFFMAAGLKIIEGYGLTETAPVLTVNPFDRPRFGTVGWVLPGISVAIQRLSDNQIVGIQRGEDYPDKVITTEEGEILAKGPNIMKGYWNKPEETKAVFDADGWFHTGDVGCFDQGYLVITDRIKHMIVTKGGKNVYPGPIEEQIKRALPLIDQIVVIGEGREFLTALIVPDMEALESFAREKGIAYSEPKELLQHPEVLKLFKQVFTEYNKQAPTHEKIRDFRLLEEPFTVENNLLTPTLKPKRRLIEERYANLIEEMYKGVL